jgi:hypothetical protein
MIRTENFDGTAQRRAAKILHRHLGGGERARSSHRRIGAADIAQETNADGFLRASGTGKNSRSDCQHGNSSMTQHSNDHEKFPSGLVVGSNEAS